VEPARLLSGPARGGLWAPGRHWHPEADQDDTPDGEPWPPGFRRGERKQENSNSEKHHGTEAEDQSEKRQNKKIRAEPNAIRP